MLDARVSDLLPFLSASLSGADRPEPRGDSPREGTVLDWTGARARGHVPGWQGSAAGSHLSPPSRPRSRPGLGPASLRTGDYVGDVTECSGVLWCIYCTVSSSPDSCCPAPPPPPSAAARGLEGRVPCGSRWLGACPETRTAGWRSTACVTGGEGVSHAVPRPLSPSWVLSDVRSQPGEGWSPARQPVASLA